MPYRVYVISLKKEVLNSKKFRKRNPDYQKGQPCYYVGVTRKDPSVRAQQHRVALRNEKGPLYSRLAHKYFNGLTKKYSSLRAVPSKQKAEQLETNVANKLQSKGFGVWWN